MGRECSTAGYWGLPLPHGTPATNGFLRKSVIVYLNLEDGAIGRAFIEIETKRAPLKANKCFTSLRHAQTQYRFIKVHRFAELIRLNQDIAGRRALHFHGDLS